jgi:hypothetical protein
MVGDSEQTSRFIAANLASLIHVSLHVQDCRRLIQQASRDYLPFSSWASRNYYEFSPAVMSTGCKFHSVRRNRWRRCFFTAALDQKTKFWWW